MEIETLIYYQALYREIKEWESAAVFWFHQLLWQGDCQNVIGIRLALEKTSQKNIKCWGVNYKLLLALWNFDNYVSTRNNLEDI